MRITVGVIIAVCCAIWATNARAGDLYVCKAPGQATAYQDHPCAHQAQAVGHSHFKSTPYAPPPAPAPATALDQPAVEAPTLPAQYAQQTPDPIVGWICSFGSRRWLQFFPCPATIPRGQTVDVDGFSTYSGEPIHGTADVAIQVPVQQQPLTAVGVCTALGDPSLRVPHHGSSDVYERGKLKHKFCPF